MSGGRAGSRRRLPTRSARRPPRLNMTHPPNPNPHRRREGKSDAGWTPTTLLPRKTHRPRRHPRPRSTHPPTSACEQPSVTRHPRASSRRTDAQPNANDAIDQSPPVTTSRSRTRSAPKMSSTTTTNPPRARDAAWTPARSQRTEVHRQPCPSPCPYASRSQSSSRNPRRCRRERAGSASDHTAAPQAGLAFDTPRHTICARAGAWDARARGCWHPSRGRGPLVGGTLAELLNPRSSSTYPRIPSRWVPWGVPTQLCRGFLGDFRGSPCRRWPRATVRARRLRLAAAEARGGV